MSTEIKIFSPLLEMRRGVYYYSEGTPDTYHIVEFEGDSVIGGQGNIIDVPRECTVVERLTYEEAHRRLFRPFAVPNGPKRMMLL